ncbi:hypothetical protein ACH5RR_002294 [Cinchona calisaya]|uniref:Uncharacterized protein n=1 Tax=Cinchona calisaya TaxID=153742 RepID=A0ABD3B5V0_9GENT
MVLDDGDVKLHLYRKVGAHRCGRKGRSSSYGSMYNLHLACVKKMLVESWQKIYFGVRNGNTRKLETRIPCLKSTLQTYHRKKSEGKVQTCCEIAASALQFAISAVLGDPTTFVDGVVGSLVSK